MYRYLVWLLDKQKKMDRYYTLVPDHIKYIITLSVFGEFGLIYLGLMSLSTHGLKHGFICQVALKGKVFDENLLKLQRSYI